MRLACVAALLTAAAFAASAADASVEIELNKLESTATGCQAYLVLRNPGGVSHDSLRLDLVLFDTDGLIVRRLAVEAGPLPTEKTMVKAFVAEGVACDGVGSVLLNDVLSCGGEGRCLDAVLARGRAPLTFTK